MAIETTTPQATQAPQSAPTPEPTSRVSIDPIVAQVHALREQQWQVYGEDTRAWFDALLRSQARRVNA
jgi:hypothetical protein